MDEHFAVHEVRQLVQDLLSKDPAVFISAINAYFASGCTYKGRGVEIHGVSQIKHAVWLINFLDYGSPEQITDSNIVWNQETLTAAVYARRNIRPAFFPFVQLAWPSKIELTFNGDVDNGLLFCTRVVDKWPLLMMVETMPIFGRWYKSVFVPLLTTFVLLIANVAFFLHSKLSHYSTPGSAYIEPKALAKKLPGFQTGIDMAERVGQRSSHLVSSVVHGPLLMAERLAQTGTRVCNLALPRSLQLPYPRVYAETKPTSTEKSVETSPQMESDTTFVDSPERKVAGLPQTAESRQLEPVGEAPQNDSAQSKVEAQQETAPEPSEQRGVESEAPKPQESHEPAHAQVIIGSADDGTSSHQEIDVVTKEVTNVAHEESKLGPSLYDELKQDGKLPAANLHGKASSSTGPPSQSGSVSKKKSNKRKPKPAPPRQFNLSKPSNDTPSPTSPKSAKGGNH